MSPYRIVDSIILAAEILGVFVDPLIKPLENTTVATLSALFPSLAARTSKFLAENESVFAKRLPLMNPFHVILITLAYLTVVFVGKRVMESRPKMSVKTLSTVHNTFLVILSTYMCLSILIEAHRRGYGLFGNPDDKTENGWTMAKLIWLFYVSKIAEFMDTFIMVLKKNDRQITFLHVYHHCSIFVIWWLVTYVAPTGESYFSAALNSAIHIIMYGYYLSTALSVPIQFIKRYITLLQMTQFTLMMIQATYDIILFQILLPNSKEKYPFILTALLWVYMWTMLGLFANFFVADRKRERDAKMKAQ